MAATLSHPELILSQEECDQLALATTNVARHYVDTRRHEKTIDWGHLIIALGMIYGPRLVAIRNNAPARLRVVVPIKSGNVPDGMEEIDIPGVGKALRPKDLQ